MAFAVRLFLFLLTEKLAGRKREKRSHKESAVEKQLAGSAKAEGCVLG